IAGSGALLGFATAVRVSNITIAALVAVILAFRVDRRTFAVLIAALAGGGAIVASFWSLGYATFGGGRSESAPLGLFSWHYLARSWRDSAVFDWRMLVILLPLPLLGAYAIRKLRLELLLLCGTVAVTAAFYSVYYITALHPRFLFVALPELFVLT